MALHMTSSGIRADIVRGPGVDNDEYVCYGVKPVFE